MRRITLLLAWIIGVILFLSLIGAPTSWGKETNWHRAGASTFGGWCEPSEWQGYKTDNLTLKWRSFAELGNGYALGGLAHNTRIRVLNPATGRRLTIRKRDIGKGGGPVNGHRRSIDLYWRVTQYLDRNASCSSWTGTILWRYIK